jgi:hypothetical protein
MGADGHIQIYDLKKIETALGERWKRIREQTSDARIYEHSFKTPTGEEIPVLTRYWGDNLYYSGLWTSLANYSTAADIKKNADLYGLESISDSEFEEMAKDVQWIEKECRLGYSWEVWT